MQTAVQRIGDTYLLVTPDGRPIPHQDCEDWTLHILPKILVKFQGADVKLIEAELKVRTTHPRSFLRYSFSRHNVLPPDVTIRQPLPNANYYLAGTLSRKMGWEFQLQDNQTWAELVLRWLVTDGLQGWDVKHRITFNLEPTQQGHLYSMQSANYAFGDNARAIALLDPSQADNFFTKGDPSFKIKASNRAEEDVLRLDISQTLDLKSHAWSDVPDVKDCEETTLLRDVNQVRVFSTYQAEHRAAACIEIPNDLLYSAIMNARCFAEADIYSYWRSDGVITLTDWWNHCAPTPEYRRAGGFSIWCRVADDDQYWNAWGEVPNVDFSFIKERWNPSACARWSDFVLIDFMQPPSAYVRHEGWLDVLSVDGTVAFDVGCMDADHDEAYYSWHSLRQFPVMFPAAWEILQA